MKQEPLPTGKLESRILQQLVFNNIKYQRPEVTTKPGIGEDCAVIDFGKYDCVLSSDPITASVADIGRLSIHISCNDIASNGIEPLGIMLVILLPVGTVQEDIKCIMEQAAEAAEHCGVEIIGGHTEITSAVNKPVIVSTALGRGLKGQSQSAKNMRVGDLIYLTKTAGIEGTGIIACDLQEEVAQILSAEELQIAQEMIDQVSVVPEGIIAGRIGTSGMHDITEGGVLGAVWELCSVAECGATIVFEQIPVAEVTKKICAHFSVDYLKLISSGCMLIIVPPHHQKEMSLEMEKAGILFTCIGEVTAAEPLLEKDGFLQPIEPPAADEIYKVVS
ncbi:MAG: AIR synthase family protein [Bacillota bacterium]|jgi:hydrogenase expression/formation protein HypE